MKNFLKKYILLFLAIIAADIFVIIISTNKSGYELTMPGDIGDVNSIIQVENGITLSGSFNTVSVYTYDHVTSLQAALLGFENDTNNPTYDISEPSVYYNLSHEEDIYSGKIQKEQSLETSLINAYKSAELMGYDVHLDYEFKGFIIYLYFINQPVLRVGDLITSVDTVEGETYGLDQYKELYYRLYDLKSGDIVHFTRNDSEMTYVLDEDINGSSEENFEIKKNVFRFYFKYEINALNSTPHFTIGQTNTLGPSGGFLQALSTYCQLVGIDPTKGGKKITGTGTIENNFLVGPIGGIKQKIVTAIRNDCDYFLCPAYHYKEALEAYNQTIGHEKMKLIEIPFAEGSGYYSSYLEALKILEELAK